MQFLYFRIIDSKNKEEENPPKCRPKNPAYEEKESTPEIEKFLKHFVKNIQVNNKLQQIDPKILKEICQDQEFIHKGIQNLQELENLDKKAADKAVGTTINDKEKYIEDMNKEHLQDTSTFKMIGHVTNKIVKNLKEEIVRKFTKKLATYLNIDNKNRDPKKEDYHCGRLYDHLTKRCHEDYFASDLYGLIKIHKLSLEQLKNIQNADIR